MELWVQYSQQLFSLPLLLYLFLHALEAHKPKNSFIFIDICGGVIVQDYLEFLSMTHTYKMRTLLSCNHPESIVDFMEMPECFLIVTAVPLLLFWETGNKASRKRKVIILSMSSTVWPKSLQYLRRSCDTSHELNYMFFILENYSDPSIWKSGHKC